MSTDYHEYVIARSRLVGAWDEMYGACDDPWHQSKDARSEGRRAVAGYARDIGASSLVEIGCGLGYFTAELDRQGFEVAGLGTSTVAIERARTLHPHLADRLQVGRVEEELGRFAGVDAVVFAEVTCYVLDRLDTILAELRRNQAGAHLIHLLTFYPPGRQRYGREFFTTPEELIRRFALEVVASSTFPSRTGDDFASVILFRIP